MTQVQATQKVKEQVIEAVVIRADGTRQELGTISYWHRNPLKRLAFAIKGRIKNG